MPVDLTGIGLDGAVIITKPEGSDGIIMTKTCKERLLYKIQGMYYLNCNVTAIMDKARLTQVAKDWVELSGVTEKSPPATAKAGTTASGGYTAELHWALVGLDIEERVKMAEILTKYRNGPERSSQFTHFSLTTYGSVPTNPRS